MNKRWLRGAIIFLGVILGGLGGYFYYVEIGCHSGACPIWSNPFLSTGYGALLGGFFANLAPVGHSKQKERVES